MDPKGFMVNPSPSKYKYIAANATTIVKASPGVLQRITVGAAVASVIDIHDHAASANGLMAEIAANTVGTFEFGSIMANGIVVVCAGDAKFTVMYD